jgi:hypothetical protein
VLFFFFFRCAKSAFFLARTQFRASIGDALNDRREWHYKDNGRILVACLGSWSEFQQVSLTEEEFKLLVAEFLDVRSEVTFITSADYWL